MDSTRNQFTRREVIGTASAALGAAMLPRLPSGARVQTPQAPPQGYQVGKDPGTHAPLDEFKYDLENSSAGWVGEAGSAKESTVAEFPASQNIAGVSMRLKPGAIRELHWHAIAAEWAFVITGTVRGTVISPAGEPATDIFEPGDLWYFPKGHGHAVQNVGKDDVHFILGFDDGHFSEFGTFSITDWVARTPPEIVARNLNLPLSVVKNLPTKEMYIIPGNPPATLPEPSIGADQANSQIAHKFRLGASPIIQHPGGWQRMATVKEFPINDTLTSVLQYLEPGSLRELHWHPNADEWQYYLSGRSRVTIFGAHSRAKTEEFGPGQVCFVQQGFGHYVEQVGSEPTKFFALFNSPTFEEISISKWLAGNPATLLMDNFGLSRDDVARLPKTAMGIIK